MHLFVDAMGGDNAPQAIVKGSVDAVNAYGTALTLVGRENEIAAALNDLSYPKDAIAVLNADDVISFDEEPVYAIRHKDQSSLVVAFDAMKAYDDAVLVSAGSTGALLAGGLFKLGRIKGIKRPALATPFPKNNGITLMIDSGANADCKPEYLLQFGVLGTVYAESVMGVKNPKVGLVNIGAESEKGSTLTKKAYELLKKSQLNFIGNVEARDIPTTEADILVTDGFTGNVVLKFMEGLAGYLLHSVKDAVMSSAKGKLGGLLIKNDLKALKHKFSADDVGGAPFLGVKGGVIKAHGSSSAYAFQRAIEKAISFEQGDVLNKITAAIQETQTKE